MVFVFDLINYIIISMYYFGVCNYLFVLWLQHMILFTLHFCCYIQCTFILEHVMIHIIYIYVCHVTHTYTLSLSLPNIYDLFIPLTHYFHFAHIHIVLWSPYLIFTVFTIYIYIIIVLWLFTTYVHPLYGDIVY